jgi:hypothetical protein
MTVSKIKPNNEYIYIYEKHVLNVVVSDLVKFHSCKILLKFGIKFC